MTLRVENYADHGYSYVVHFQTLENGGKQNMRSCIDLHGMKYFEVFLYLVICRGLKFYPKMCIKKNGRQSYYSMKDYTDKVEFLKLNFHSSKTQNYA